MANTTVYALLLNNGDAFQFHGINVIFAKSEMLKRQNFILNSSQEHYHFQNYVFLQIRKKRCHF